MSDGPVKKISLKEHILVRFDLSICLSLALLTGISTILLDAGGIIRALISLPFMVFVPGYLLSLLLWGDSKGVGTIERGILSVVLSILSLVVVGIVLGLLSLFTPFILISLLISLTIFLVLLSVYLRSKSSTEVQIRSDPRPLIKVWKGHPDRSQYLTLAVLMVVISIVLLAMVMSPRPVDGYTEFYILDEDGELDGLPGHLSVREVALVNLTLINHEGVSSTYDIVPTLMDNSTGAIQYLGNLSVGLDHGQSWSHGLNISINTSGNYILRFTLYKDEVDIDQELHLWIEVGRGGI